MFLGGHFNIFNLKGPIGTDAEITLPHYNGLIIASENSVPSIGLFLMGLYQFECVAGNNNMISKVSDYKIKTRSNSFYGSIMFIYPNYD